LGDILLRNTNLTEEQLEAARRELSEAGGNLAQRLVAAGRVTADEVMQALSDQLGLPIRAQIHRGDVDEALIERVPIAFAKDHGIVPLQRERDAIRVAVLDPLDTTALDDLRLLFEGADLRLELANQRTILGAINEVYDRGPGLTDALAEDAAEDLSVLAT